MEFETDPKLAYAVLYCLQIIGEAAVKVSSTTQEERPELPWSVMRGLRNRLVHAYFDVKLAIVWDTVQKDLPPLIESLEQILGSEQA